MYESEVSEFLRLRDFDGIRHKGASIETASLLTDKFHGDDIKRFRGREVEHFIERMNKPTANCSQHHEA